MAERPTLYVCHGDQGGPPGHPCSRVQKAMRAKGIESTRSSPRMAARSRSCARARATSCSRDRRPEATDPEAPGWNRVQEFQGDPPLGCAATLIRWTHSSRRSLPPGRSCSRGWRTEDTEASASAACGDPDVCRFTTVPHSVHDRSCTGLDRAPARPRAQRHRGRVGGRAECGRTACRDGEARPVRAW